MYTSLGTENISRGNILKLFSSKKIFIKYLCCIAIGVPIWYVIGILIALARDISAAKGISNIITGNAVMYFYLGTAFGDFMSGYLSQVFKSRIKIVFLYLSVTIIAVPMYLFIPFINATHSFVYWILCAVPIAAIAAAGFLYPAKKWFPLILHWLIVAFVIAFSYFVK